LKPPKHAIKSICFPFKKPALMDGAKSVSEDLKAKIFESMSILDSFVANSLWFAGETVTLADLTILANVTQIQACGYDLSQHVNLSKWLERCKVLPGFDENQKGADELSRMFKAQIPNAF
jgi:glutathione S-transferase